MTITAGLTIPDASFGGPPLADFAAGVERLGFDYLACGEHVMFHGPTPNAFVSLAFAAAATERIELVSTVTLAPLYPPALLAKMAAALDVVSGGRFNLGIGLGGEFPAEYDACGVPVGERAARTDEILALLDRLWSGETVDADGRFARVHGRLQPPPVRRPPLWIGGRRQAALRRVARFGDVWIPYLVTPEQVAAGAAQLDEHIRTMVFCFVSVDADGRAAEERVASRVGATYQQDFSTIGAKYLVAGSPDRCRHRLQEYVDAGADGVVLAPVAPRSGLDAMVRLLAEDVLPGVS